MEILNHQAFSDQMVAYIVVTVDATGLLIEVLPQTVTYPTNRPSPRMGNHPVPWKGCHFVIGGCSISARSVWGVENGLQEAVKDCSPQTPFPRIVVSGYALPESEAEATAAMVQNALAKAKALHREARVVADSLDDGIEKATKAWESRHA